MIFNKPFDDDIFNKMKATGYWNVKNINYRSTNKY